MSACRSATSPAPRISISRRWRRSATAWSCRFQPSRPDAAPQWGFGPPGAEEDFQSGKPSFWIGEGEPLAGHFHVAFVAQSRADVDAFYDAALAAGGNDNGKPGLRPQYHANYYGAFVLDPDGNNIEAVCHAPA